MVIESTTIPPTTSAPSHGCPDFCGLLSGTYSGAGECLQDRAYGGDCDGRSLGKTQWTPFFSGTGESFSPYGCPEGLWCCCERNPVVSCDTISHPVERDWCYSNAGADLANATLCDMTESQYWREACYRSIGIAASDPEMCTRIGDARRRDSCYLEVAVAAGGEAICQKIGDDTLRELCIIQNAASGRRLPSH